jgi:hypothetical protein
MSAVLFTPDILQSYPRFKAFFDSKEEVSQVVARASLARPESYGARLLHRPWEVALLEATVCFHQTVLSIVLKGLRSFLDCIGAKALAIRCAVLDSYYGQSEKILKIFRNFKERLIAPARNVHKWDTGDVYLQPAIPTPSIRDPNVRSRAFPLYDTPSVLFFQNEGICRGICHWFTHLYFATKAQFRDPAAHMIALTRQFEEGASRQAALTHSFYDTETPLLHLNKQVSQFSFRKFARSHEVVHSLAPGAYNFGVPGHCVNYIKVSNDLGYLFDPNGGVLEFKGSQHYYQVWYCICSYYSAEARDKDVEITSYQSAL